MKMTFLSQKDFTSSSCLWHEMGRKRTKRSFPCLVGKWRCHWWKLDSSTGKKLWRCSGSQHLPEHASHVTVYVKMLLYIHSIIVKFSLWASCEQETHRDPSLRGHRRFHSHVVGKQHTVAASRGLSWTLSYKSLWKVPPLKQKSFCIQYYFPNNLGHRITPLLFSGNIYEYLHATRTLWNW